MHPIVQIWDHLNSKLKQTNLNKDSLWASFLAEWQTITVEKLTEYISNMKDRCQAVIDAGGGHTKY